MEVTGLAKKRKVKMKIAGEDVRAESAATEYQA